MRRLILLGDSIFDNAAYLRPGERDVTAHLRARLSPSAWTVERRAVDGATVIDVPAQLDRAAVVPPCVFVLSAGGNDAVGNADLLSDPSRLTFADVLVRLHAIKEAFRLSYVATMERVLRHAQPLVTCTIYNPRFDDPRMQRASEAALSIYNDVIMQEALRRRLPLVDLRLVCTEAVHFANPIEPSDAGGACIAGAIAAAVDRL